MGHTHTIMKYLAIGIMAILISSIAFGQKKDWLLKQR